MNKINKMTRDHINKTITFVQDFETYEETTNREGKDSELEGFNWCLYYLSKFFENAESLKDITEVKFIEEVTRYENILISSFYVKEIINRIKQLTENDGGNNEKS